MCWPCCFTHYKAAIGPAIGKDIISAHDATKHKMSGDVMTLIEVTVPAQQTMIAEPGSFVYSEQGVKMQSLWHDGSTLEEPGCCFKCSKCCMRCCCTGESGTMMHFTNTSDAPKQVAFGQTYPGQLLAIDLNEMPENMIFAMNSSFHFAARGVRLGVVRADCLQGCCGSGYLFQKLDGNGMVFLSAGGTVVKQELKGEKHRIDSQTLVAFTKGLEINVQRAGGCCTICCGGEGAALTTLEGTGTYWISTSPWEQQVQYALQFLPPKE